MTRAYCMLHSATCKVIVSGLRVEVTQRRLNLTFKSPNLWNIHTKAIRPLTTFPGWQKQHYKETAGSISMTSGDTCHLCVCKRRRTPVCTVGLRRTQEALMLASGHSHLLSCFSVSWHLITGTASISTNWYHCFILYGKSGPYISNTPRGYREPLQSILSGCPIREQITASWKVTWNTGTELCLMS